MMTKRDAAFCLCMIFLDPVTQLPSPPHGPELDAASSGKGANGKGSKSEKLAKPSQKRRMTPLSQN
jgi:hypothetical protein